MDLIAFRLLSPLSSFFLPPSSVFSMAAWMDKLNVRVARSAFGRYFQLEGSGHRRERKGTLFTTEIRAGLTT